VTSEQQGIRQDGEHDGMQGSKQGGSPTMLRNGLIFLGIVACVYAAVAIFAPGTAASALTASLTVFKNVVLPLCLVFLALVLTNLFLRPHQVAKMLGRGSGLRGSALALGAGIASTGPVYAWYPLLGSVRRQGGGAAQISVFMFGRAIKPFLLPAMVAYFGLAFTIVLNLLIALGAFFVGWITEKLPVHDDI